MLGAQILGIIVGLIMLLIVFIGYRRRQFSRMDSILWVMISLAIILFSIDPNFPIVLLNYATIERINALTVSGILILFVIDLRLHLRIEETNRMLTSFVQKIALELGEKKAKSSSMPSSEAKIHANDDKEF